MARLSLRPHQRFQAAGHCLLVLSLTLPLPAANLNAAENAAAVAEQPGNNWINGLFNGVRAAAEGLEWSDERVVGDWRLQRRTGAEVAEARILDPADRIIEVADAVAGAGAEAVTCINTLLGLAYDPETLHPTLGAGGGGLSGRAIHPVAVRAVHDVCAALPELPVIGVGGGAGGGGRLKTNPMPYPTPSPSSANSTKITWRLGFGRNFGRLRLLSITHALFP